MVLSKSNTPILFSGGLDQKRPEKLSIPGRFLRLENCIRRKYGEIQKRYGFNSLGSDVINSSDTIDSGTNLANFREDVLLFTDFQLFSYASASDNWIYKGEIVNNTLSSTPVIRNGAIQAMPDMASNGGFTATVWEDSRGGVGYSIFDDATGSAVVSDAQLDVTGFRPKVYAVRDNFIICYIVGTTLYSRLISTAMPATIGAAVSIQSGVVANKPWDVTPAGTAAVFVYNNTSSGLTIGYIDANGVVGSISGNALPDPVSIASGTALGSDCTSIYVNETTGIIYIFYHDAATSTNLRVTAITGDLVTMDTQTIEAIANTRNVTATEVDGLVCVFYEMSAASVKNHFVKSRVLNAWSGSGSVTFATAASVFARSVGLATKAFVCNGDVYVTVAHESGLQPTYFVMRYTDALIVTKMAQSFGGGVTRDSARVLKSGLCRVSLSDDGYIGGIQIRNELSTEAGGTILSTQVGINRFAIAFAADAFKTSSLGENLAIAGGLVQAYDGVSVNELGFNIYPEDVTTAASAGGSLTAGTYAVQVVYEWVDGRGQVHQSAPSIIKTQAAALNQKITVTIPTLRLTAKASIVNCVVYVAAKDTTVVYYRHGVVANSKTVDTVTYEILTEAVATNEVLYTVGGVLDNIAPPAAGVIHQHKNRFFIADLEDGSIGYSKESVVQEGVGFSDFFRIAMEADGGRVRGLATLDSNLIIMKRDRIYYLPGDGPVATGAQNDYPRPVPIASDVGTENPNSIAETPVGIFFKSSKGIYLLQRNLTTKYVGEGVEDFNGLDITSAVVLADENEVRFTTGDGATLIYNYFFQQWSTFANYEAVSAVRGLDSYLHLKADGTVNMETVGAYMDNGSKFSMAIETSWLALSQVQGFQRIYRLLLLGDFVSHHFTKLKLAYDYENSYNEEVYFDTRTGLVSENYYGAGDPYGLGVDEEAYGGVGSSVYQFRVRPRRQKCEAIKLRIEDIDTINLIGGGSFKLVAINAEVGRKVGAYRLPPRKTIGSA